MTVLTAAAVSSPHDPRPMLGAKATSAPALINTNKSGIFVVEDDALCREWGMDKDGTCLIHPHVLMYHPSPEGHNDGKGPAAYSIEPCQFCASREVHSITNHKKHTKQNHRRRTMEVYDVGQVKDLDIPVVKDEAGSTTIEQWTSPTANKKKWHNSMNWVQEENELDLLADD